jgi:NADH:ubiquinone oxidoreductase subunit 4 (subunit M)
LSWYGAIYYTYSAFFIYFLLLLFFKVVYFLYINRNNIYQYLIILTVAFIIFFSFSSLSSLYYLFDVFGSIVAKQAGYLNYYENETLNYLLNLLNLNLILMGIYYFPFIYIFVIVTVLSVLFCLSYSLNEMSMFVFYCTIIIIAGYMLFLADSLILFFLAYEMLLVPSFFILYKFAKTRRCIEAAYLMFFWTQFGALSLIFSFLYLFFMCETSSFYILSYLELSLFEVNFLFIFWVAGFGVKLPIWPFYGWLPKAHVEASTNFSIFLSGVLVKFAFFGLLKCLSTLQLEPTAYFIYPFLLIGIIDAVFKLFYQIDLKKLVAYSTVVEMHWLTICVISGQSCLMLASFCMLISHALLSSNSFLLVDAINRRFKTRLITEISGVNYLSPKLFLVSLANCLVFLGFPGSIFFIAEVLFFSFFFDLFPLLCLFLIPFLYLLGPTFFFRSWMNALFGLSGNIFKKIPLDLNAKEFILYVGLIFLMFWLGFTW